MSDNPRIKAQELRWRKFPRLIAYASDYRIQQFPDDWKFTGTVSAQYRQIGNAVPVGLAEAIGKAIISTAENTATIETKRFRGTSVHNRIKSAMEIGGMKNGN